MTRGRRSALRYNLVSNDAHAPIVTTLLIYTATGTIESVQVTADLKISDLVRRIRTKADLLAAGTPNPRITVNATQVGHGMTVGEASITKDGKVPVAFSYDDTA